MNERLMPIYEMMPSKVDIFNISLFSLTLRDGSTWLVHKGSGFGRSSQTVVVNARHMGGNWKVLEVKNFRGTKTVGDFVRAGGSKYHILFNNCLHGANRMINQ